MKTRLFLLSAALFLGTALALTPAGQASASSQIAAGTLIKGKNLSTIYYVAEDGKRYVFPNANTFFSWYEDFSSVQEISDSQLYSLPLAGNVTYKPGALLIKIQTDPKVYAVSEDGELNWVKTEALAKELYGNNWNKLVDDLPDSFFTNYRVGAALNSSDDFDPSELGQSYADFSQSKKFKAKHKAQAKISNQVERRCERLEKSVNQLAKRLARWGMDMPGASDDFVAECVEKNLPRYESKKITICHRADNGSTQTISISKNALWAHLKHGDSIGACAGSTPEPGDTTAPTVSSVSAAPLGTRAVISFTSSEAANCLIQYATAPIDASTTIMSKSGSAIASTSHAIELIGLATSTPYYYKIKCSDSAANTSYSDQRSFTTTAADPDTLAPAISDVAATSTAQTAVISWTTNESATGKVYYATSTLSSAANIMSVENAALVSSHSFTLTNLAASTQYFFQVESKDSANNLAQSAQFTFTTLVE